MVLHPLDIWSLKCVLISLHTVFKQLEFMGLTRWKWNQSNTIIYDKISEFWTLYVFYAHEKLKALFLWYIEHTRMFLYILKKHYLNSSACFQQDDYQSHSVLGERGWLFSVGGGGGGGCNLYIRNKLKSEIFNDKKSLQTKMFFSVCLRIRTGKF